MGTRPSSGSSRSKRSAAAAAKKPSRRPPAAKAADFAVVGVGASAGGLEAFELFLRNVPKRPGIAFVFIQHLDPTRKGMLVELLARCTPMQVAQATEGTRLEPDHVYVIPPGKDMSIAKGSLHLSPLPAARGLHLPIDHFFRSLAEDRQHNGIGVVLSGMGSDGTLGLLALKEKAGASFVESPDSAKFDGMPRSAIEAGAADVVAPASELPGRLLAYVAHAPRTLHADDGAAEPSQAALDKICGLLRAQTGNDFALYKRSTVIRRIERRMGLHQIGSISRYAQYLRDNPREVELLFKELLIGVTSFFRDAPAWDHLQNHALPELLAQRPGGGVLRAWVPGCSTGEEAYSLAMVFREVAESVRHGGASPTLQIFATDLDRDAIERARLGSYLGNIAADVAPKRLKRWFVHQDNGYRVCKEIREMVVFATQNITTDPPFTKLDILSCRNLLIYLAAELQRKLLPLFHYSLNPGGILFLGSAETTGNYASLFSASDGAARIYHRAAHSLPQGAVEFPSPVVPTGAAAREPGEATRPPGSPPLNLQSAADRILVQRFAPVGVLCTDKGDILYISGRAGKYLEPAVGKANLNIFAMARDGLRYELTGAFARAVRESRVATVRGLQVTADGASATVDLTVQKLSEPAELRGSVLVVLAEATKAASAEPGPVKRRPGEPRVFELERAIAKGQEELQTTRAEMQTSQEELKSTNEELQSTNEELQSTNEELQSTNEELTTSKEELQSLNEELQTVNHELVSKVDELSRSNNDMKNLLNSTDIATLFLDNELRVRRFTTQTARIIKLIPTDVGRPITDFASDLDYPDLAEDARGVLRTLAVREKQVATRDDRWFSVRILAYRTVDNVIDGVVITFNDVSEFRRLERALREQASQLKQLTESLPNLVWGCRADGAWDYLGPQWVQYTGVEGEEQLGYRWLEQVHKSDRSRVREEWRAAVKAGVPFDTDFRIRRGDDTYRWFKARSVPIHDSQGGVTKWYGTATDVEGIKRLESPRRAKGVRGRA